MVEKMPGFVEPAGDWSLKREFIASELLFREGLAACRMSATRAFIGILGSSSSVPKNILESPAKKVFTTVVKETTYHEDQFLASKMLGVKKAKMKQTSLSFGEK
jgi:hypothetical protein